MNHSSAPFRLMLHGLMPAIALCVLTLSGADRVRAQAPETPPAIPEAAPPAPPAAPAPPAEQARPPSETPAVVIDAGAADTLLGKPVQSATGEDMGRIIDVIVDRSGKMRAVLIDFGGFLGVGSRKIAVDWRVLHFPEGGGLGAVIAELPGDQLRVAPVYKPGEPVVVIGRSDSPPAPPPAPPPPSAAPVATEPAAAARPTVAAPP